MFRVLARADLVFLAVRFLGRVAKEAKNIALYGTVLMIVQPLVISLLFQFIDKNTLTAVTSNVPQSIMLFFIFLPRYNIHVRGDRPSGMGRVARHQPYLAWQGSSNVQSHSTITTTLAKPASNNKRIALR